MLNTYEILSMYLTTHLIIIGYLVSVYLEY